MGKRRSAEEHVARELKKSEGVLGVFSRKDGAEHRLIAHVDSTRSLPPFSRARGKKVFLEERVVGAIVPCYLDHLDLAIGDAPWGPHSTISLLAKPKNTAPNTYYALLSGHATLARNGRPIHDLPISEENNAIRVRISDNGNEIPGVVIGGAFGNGAALDFALVRIQLDNSQSAILGHMAAEKAPAPLRWAPLRRGEKVFHYSRLRDRKIYGGIASEMARSPTTLDFGSFRSAYAGVVSVESETPAAPFSIEGDSGSLVFDRWGSAVGTVLGYSLATSSIAYILPLGPLLNRLGDWVGSWFFKEK